MLPSTNQFMGQARSSSAGISVNSFTVVNANRIDASITITPALQQVKEMLLSSRRAVILRWIYGKQALPLITSGRTEQGRQGKRHVTINEPICGVTARKCRDIVNNFHILSASQVTASIPFQRTLYQPGMSLHRAEFYA